MAIVTRVPLGAFKKPWLSPSGRGIILISPNGMLGKVLPENSTEVSGSPADFAGNAPDDSEREGAGADRTDDAASPEGGTR